MINNFVICGFLSVLLFYGISSYGIIFGESNNTEYQFLNKFGGKGSEDGQLTSPHSIDIDKEGNVYVTDALLHNSFKQSIFILFYLSDSYALKQVV